MAEISAETRERANATKVYLEEKYKLMKQEKLESQNRRNTLEMEMEKLNINQDKREVYRQKLRSQELNSMRLQRKRMSIKDFTKLCIIGEGAFGQVFLVRKFDSKQIYAMKSMKKSAMVMKNQVKHIRAEREILALADNHWLVTLQYSFQDDEYLYMVMEYLPGGDLMGLLIKMDALP